MPASSGLRSRPQIGLMRPRSSHRAHLGGLVQLLPKSIVLPLALIGGLTAGFAALWTYGIHVDETYAEADGPAVEAPAYTSSIRALN
jgi:hypothetical protein